MKSKFIIKTAIIKSPDLYFIVGYILLTITFFSDWKTDTNQHISYLFILPILIYVLIIRSRIKSRRDLVILSESGVNIVKGELLLWKDIKSTFLGNKEANTGKYQYSQVYFCITTIDTKMVKCPIDDFSCTNRKLKKYVTYLCGNNQVHKGIQGI